VKNNKHLDLKNRFLKYDRSFRNSHHIVGEIVLAAENEKMPLDEFVRTYISKEVADEVFDINKAMEKRNLIDGSTGPRQVVKQLKNWRKVLDAKKKKHNTTS